MRIPLEPSSRLLITGGTGFVGRGLLRWLAQAEHGLAALRPVILSRDPAAFRARWPQLSARVELLEGDVRRFSLEGRRFTHVLHGATDTSATAHANPLEIRSAVLDGTTRVLELATEAGAQRLLFLSSGAVYGAQPPELVGFPEDYPGQPDPNDPAGIYGRAKREAEARCADWSTGGREAVIARLFAFVGEDLPLDGHFAIGNFLKDALASRPIEIKGDGSPVRTYLHQHDLAEWLVALLGRGEAARAYNVGSDEEVDIAGLARLVAEVVSPGLAVNVAKKRADYAGRHRYVPSIARAKAELGLSVKIPLREAIARTAASHRRAG